MKFSICNDTYTDRDCHQAAQHAASIGYQGLELAPSTIWEDPGSITPQQASKLSSDIHSTGLEIVGFHWLLTGAQDMHLTHPDTKLQDHLVDYVTHLARLCSDMGGKIMVWGSPALRNLEEDWSRDEAEKRAIDALHRICLKLAPLGVSLALEPLAKWETNFWTTADETWTTIEKVDHPNCQLHLDCKAMHDEDEGMSEIIYRHKDHFIHFHANDPNLLGPGMGELDLKPVGQTLRDIGYQDWISVETFKPGPGPEEIARQSIEYMKTVF